MSPIVILCNGPSLKDHFDAGNLKRIPCETIGVNRSWEVMRSSYHVMIDPAQWEMYKRVTGEDPSTIPNLYTGPKGPGAIKLTILDSVEPRFSWEPIRYGAWLCGAVSWVALQLAVSFKRNPIYFIGLDLKRRGCDGKFWGGTWDPIAEPRQRELFGYAEGLLRKHHCIDIFNICIRDEDTKCHAFRKVRFEEVFG